MDEKLKAFARILQIMDELRAQCPWDKKQTFETLRPLSIEEVYELSDAILQGDSKGIKEEIGDILLHIVFYAKIGEEKGEFDIATVINTLCDKLITRHPHIYGDVSVKDEEEVKQNWEKIKLKEGKGKRTVLGGVPNSLPALIKAYRIQDKAAQVKFEWDKIEDVWAKVEEESAELQEAVSLKNQEQIEEEFGDLMFALVNYSRFLKVDAEAALERTNLKFMRRFNYIESEVAKRELSMDTMTLDEMDAIWNEAKANGL